MKYAVFDMNVVPTEHTRIHLQCSFCLFKGWSCLCKLPFCYCLLRLVIGWREEGRGREERVDQDDMY